MRRKIYLDNNATTQVAPEVAETMTPYLTSDYGHPISIHTLGLNALDALKRSRNIIAKAIGGESEGIVFTSGATEASDLAIRGVAYANRDWGNHIITTRVEHPSVLRICEALENEGFNVDYLGVDKEGFVNLEEMKARLNSKTILVNVMQVNDEIGTIEPIEEVAEILNGLDRKVYLHVDAAASFMKIPVDIRKSGIDLLSLSAHKIHGPKGVGALYVQRDVRIRNTSYGYVSTSSLRPGTENVPGIVGFAKATELGLQDMGTKAQHVAGLRDLLIESIEHGIPDVILNGPQGTKRSPNNVNFCFRYVEGESILLHLDLLGVAVSTGSSCATHKLEPSHVLTAIGCSPEDAHGSIRFTLGRYNTQEEVEYVLRVLPDVVQNLRKMSPIGRGKPESVQ